MRIAYLIAALTLAGCTQTPPAPSLPAPVPTPAVTPVPTGAPQAVFPQYPANLFFAAGAVCDGPGQTLKRPSVNEVRCESLPDPVSAAAIILQFNGTVEDLPTFVVSFSGRDAAPGYLVTADNYIRVPTRGGQAQHVRFPDATVTQDLRAVMRAAGGRPI